MLNYPRYLISSFLIVLFAQVNVKGQTDTIVTDFAFHKLILDCKITHVTPQAIYFESNHLQYKLGRQDVLYHSAVKQNPTQQNPAEQNEADVFKNRISLFAKKGKLYYTSTDTISRDREVDVSVGFSPVPNLGLFPGYMQTPLINVNLAYMPCRYFSIGPSLNFGTNAYNSATFNYSIGGWRALFFLPLGAHPVVEPYAGALAVMWVTTSDGQHVAYDSFGALAGLRFHLSTYLNAFVETSSGFSYVSMGATLALTSHKKVGVKKTRGF